MRKLIITTCATAFRSFIIILPVNLSLSGLNIRRRIDRVMLLRERYSAAPFAAKTGISQARPRTSERDCRCFVSSRKRRLLTALPLQNCGKGDAEWKRERLADADTLNWANLRQSWQVAKSADHSRAHTVQRHNGTRASSRACAWPAKKPPTA